MSHIVKNYPALEIPMPRHIKGKLIIAAAPYDMTSSEPTDLITRDYFKYAGVTRVCPLVSKVSTNLSITGKKISIMEALTRMEKECGIKLTPWFISANQPLDIGKIREELADLVAGLHKGQVIFMFGENLHDRSPFVAAGVIQMLFKSRTSEVISDIRALPLMKGCLNQRREIQALEDSHLSSVGLEINGIIKTLYRQVMHSKLQDDAGLTLSEWYTQGINTIYILGGDRILQDFLKNQGFEVKSYPVTLDGIIASEKENELIEDIRVSAIEGDERVLLLDNFDRSASLLTFAYAARKFLGLSAEQACRAILEHFPGTEFNNSQVERLCAIESLEQRISKEGKIEGDSAPFNQTIKLVKNLAIEPGFGEIYTAPLSIETCCNQKGVEAALREEKIRHVIIVCSRKEAAAYACNIETVKGAVKACRVEVDGKVYKVGFDFFELPPGDQAPDQDIVMDATDELITQSGLRFNTLLMTPRNDMQRAGVVLTTASGQGMGLGFVEAQETIGFDPGLSILQAASMKKHLKPFSKHSCES